MANKKSILVIVLLAVILTAASLAVIFLWQAEPEGIVIGISTLPDSLNPILEQNLQGKNANELIFDGLANWEVDVQSGKRYVDNALAENIVQDELTKKIYTITLKQAQWHDKTPVTAQDVKFSFDAYMLESNQSPHREYLASFIDSVNVIDDQNLTIEFRKPIPDYAAIPILTFKIIPSVYQGQKLSTDLRSGKLEQEFAKKPIGSGPFVLDAWEIGKWLSFKANPVYFRKVPGSDSVVLRNIIDPVVRLNEFRQKRLNMILETSPIERPEVEKIGNVTFNSFVPYAFYQVAFNTKSELFSNLEARQALSHIVDRAALAPSITDRDGMAVLNNGPFPSNIFDREFEEFNIKPFTNYMPLNMSQAKDLAQKTGLAGKIVGLLYPDSLGEFGDMVANNLVTQFALLGLTVEAKKTGDQVFKRLVFAEKNYDMALVYSDGFDNFYDKLNTWYRSNGVNNIYGLSDRNVDKLFDNLNAVSLKFDMSTLIREIHDDLSALAVSINLFTLQKDVYSRAIKNVVIASDNPFLSVEEWEQVK